MRLIYSVIVASYVVPCRELFTRAAAGKAGSSVGSLLESRNADGQTALHIAAMRGYSDIVELILQHPEADVEVLDKDGDTPIVFAVASGTPECLKALIKKGANVNARLKEGMGPAVAHVCAFHGQPDCMRVCGTYSHLIVTLHIKFKPM